MKKINLTTLPQIKDCISFFYIEYARIEQDEFSICFIRGKEKITIPIATIAALLLGPGTSITHGAVKTIAESGCIIIWCKKDMNGIYTAGNGRTHNGKNLLSQIKAHENRDLHLKVVRAMYQVRYPEKDMSRMSLQAMRGAEGVRVKEIYEQYAQKYNICWEGRTYKTNDFDEQDDINRALSIANSLLYDICHAVILAIGFHPGIGFIHTGNIESFVYDVADLYKHLVTIPAAFQVCASEVSSESFDKEIRITCINTIPYKKI